MKLPSQRTMLIFVLACTFAAAGAECDFHENKGKRCDDVICPKDERCVYAQVWTDAVTDPCPVVPICLPMKECPTGPQMCNPEFQCKSGTCCKQIKTTDCQHPQLACMPKQNPKAPCKP